MIAPGTNESATRALTGAVFVVVVMGAVAWSAWSNALLWGVVAALAWSEWLKAPETLQHHGPNRCSHCFLSPHCQP